MADKTKKDDHPPKPLSEIKPDFRIYGRADVQEAVKRVTANVGGIWYTRFDNEAKRFLDNDDNDAADALSFLSCVTQAFLKPSDVRRPFGPAFEMGGSRGLIPDDFEEDQVELIGDLAKWADHPILQARLFDVSWLRSRNPDAARNAVEMYVAATNFLIKQSASDDKLMVVPAIEHLERAVRLSLFAFKGDDRPAIALDEAVSIGGRLIDAGHYGMALQIEQLLYELRLGDGNERAKFIETMAANHNASIDPHTLRDLWMLAAQWYNRLDALDKSRENRINAAETMVRLAEGTVSSSDPSNMAAASHVSDALKIYRQVSGANERKDELREILAGYQSGIADEMTGHSVEMDLSDPALQASKHVAGRTLPNALAALSFMCPPSDLKNVEAQVWELATESPMQHLMSITITDRDGRTAGVVPPLLSQNSATETNAALRYHMIKVADYSYTMKGAGMVEPARATIWEEHHISENELLSLTRQSAFVPDGHERLFAKGVFEGMSGDYETALHILVPQLENAFREILKSQGHVVATKEKSDDILQEAVSLPKILKHDAIKNMLGEGLHFDFQAILTDDLGGGLRHTLAHGICGDRELNSAVGAYLFVLILRLIVTPLLPSSKNNDEVGGVHSV